MQRRCYAIDRRDDAWVVSANGIEVLTCKQRRSAVRAAEQAGHLLCCERQADELEGTAARSELRPQLTQESHPFRANGGLRQSEGAVILGDQR
jgi:hypothetical protein